VQLDDRDARIALAQAEAELAKARRMYGQTAATSTALAAQVAAREADITRARALAAAEAEFTKARIDLDRRRRLAPNGAVSGEELTSATNAFAAAQAISNSPAPVAQAASNAWRGQRATAANNALIAGTSVATAPEVQAAEPAWRRPGSIWNARWSARPSMASSRGATSRWASASRPAVC
jgi:membrane fusion protein (multidrug efflux system)